MAKGSATAENIVVKSSDGEKVLISDHRHCRVFVHYGTATTGNIVTRSFATTKNIMIKGNR